MQASENHINHSATSRVNPVVVPPDNEEVRWQQRQSFLIWCPEAGQSSRIGAATVHALYYLPLNFVLMLPRDATRSTVVNKNKTDGRIHFYTDSALSGEELALLADAIVCSEDAQPIHQTSAKFVRLADAHTAPTKDSRGNFTVSSDSPEALASALLQIAKLY